MFVKLWGNDNNDINREGKIISFHIDDITKSMCGFQDGPWWAI